MSNLIKRVEKLEPKQPKRPPEPVSVEAIAARLESARIDFLSRGVLVEKDGVISAGGPLKLGYERSIATLIMALSEICDA